MKPQDGPVVIALISVISSLTWKRGEGVNFIKKFHCLTSEFHVKFQLKNRYRTNRVTFFGIDTCLLYFRDVRLVFLDQNCHLLSFIVSAILVFYSMRLYFNSKFRRHSSEDNKICNKIRSKRFQGNFCI